MLIKSLALLAIINKSLALNNGVAVTPQMGEFILQTQIFYLFCYNI